MLSTYISTVQYSPEELGRKMLSALYGRQPTLYMVADMAHPPLLPCFHAVPKYILCHAESRCKMLFSMEMPCRCRCRVLLSNLGTLANASFQNPVQ